MEYTYKTKDTCSSEIHFKITDGRVSDISFTGGCNGNLKAVSTLTEGLTVQEITDKLKGIKCGRRPTSCADQLAIALTEANNTEK